MSNSHRGKRITVRYMTMVGVLAALVFACSLLSIPIPTALGNTRIHLGNVMCLLSGMLLGPLGGGLAAGIGSMFYDFTDPLHVASAPYTFLFKFLMGFTAGWIARSGLRRGKPWPFSWLGAITGALLYVVLYLVKSFITDLYFVRAELETALISTGQKGIVSLINGCIAAAISVPLSFAVRRGLQSAHIDEIGRK